MKAGILKLAFSLGEGYILFRIHTPNRIQPEVLMASCKKLLTTIPKAPSFMSVLILSLQLTPPGRLPPKDATGLYPTPRTTIDETPLREPRSRCSQARTHIIASSRRA